MPLSTFYYFTILTHPQVRAHLATPSRPVAARPAVCNSTTTPRLASVPLQEGGVTLPTPPTPGSRPASPHTAGGP